MFTHKHAAGLGNHFRVAAVIIFDSTGTREKQRRKLFCGLALLTFSLTLASSSSFVLPHIYLLPLFPVCLLTLTVMDPPSPPTICRSCGVKLHASFGRRVIKHAFICRDLLLHMGLVCKHKLLPGRIKPQAKCKRPKTSRASLSEGASLYFKSA